MNCFLDYHLEVSGNSPTVHYIEYGYDAQAGNTILPTRRGIFGDGVPDTELTETGDFEANQHGSSQ